MKPTWFLVGLALAVGLACLWLAPSPAAAGGLANCANPEDIVQGVICADPLLRQKDQALLAALKTAAKSMDGETRQALASELDVLGIELGNSIAHVVADKGGDDMLHAAMDMGRGHRESPILLVDAALDDQLAIVTHLDLRSASGLQGQWANSEGEVRIVDKGGGQYDAAFSLARTGWPKSYCRFTAHFETKGGEIVAEKAVSTLAAEGLPTGPFQTHIQLIRKGAALHAVQSGKEGASEGASGPRACGFSNVDTRFGAPLFHLTQVVQLKGTGPQ